MAITHERLLELVHYEPITGIFTRRRTTHETWIPIGSVAGWKNGNGYFRMRIDGRQYFMHRLAWFYVHGKWPNQIDHINRNRSDNRLSNLRECTDVGNRMNIGPTGRIKIKGVQFDKVTKRWRTIITANGERQRPPRFSNQLDAAICYNYHAAYLHTDFAYLNPIEQSQYIHD